MTMQQTSAPAPAAPAAPSAAPATPASAPQRSTVDDRTSALAAQLSDESDSTESHDDETPGTETREPAKADATPSADDAAAKGRAERQARIAKARAKEREDQATRQKREQRDRQERANSTELETLRAKLKELEPLNAAFATKDSFLAEAERRGHTPQEMIEHWRKKLTDPAAITAIQQKTLEDTLRAEIAALNKKIDDDKAQRVQETQSQREAREAHEAAVSFNSQTDERVSTHPRSANLKKKLGDINYIAFVNHAIVPFFPNGYHPDELHDHVEEFLDLVSGLEQSSTPAAPANGASPPKKNGAEQPVTTLGNGHGVERTAVQEAVPVRNLSLDQRAERLKAMLGNE